MMFLATTYYTLQPLCHDVRPGRPQQTITCSARQSRAALLAWRVT